MTTVTYIYTILPYDNAGCVSPKLFFRKEPMMMNAHEARRAPLTGENGFLLKGIVLLMLLTPISMLTACGGSAGGGASAAVSAGSGSAAGTATAVLSWNAPTTNQDGSALTDLAGYKIHYGVAPDNLGTSIDVGGSTAYQVDNLTAGTTYYFTVTAYTTTGSESGYSNEVSKLVL